jgi:hypothetical protein
LRPTRAVAVAVAVLGLLATIVIAAHAVGIIRAAIDGPRLAIPGTTRVHLEHGRWIVFERTGSQDQTGPFQTFQDRSVSFGVFDVDVVTASGVRLAPRDVTGTQTLTRDSQRFTGAVEFSVPADGDVDITVRNARRGDAIVARPISDTFRGVALWAVLGIVTFAVFVLGVVFIFVPKRRDTDPVAVRGAPPMTVPPGWYPDPSGQPVYRWWNGWQWTDQVMR